MTTNEYPKTCARQEAVVDVYQSGHIAETVGRLREIAKEDGR